MPMKNHVLRPLYAVIAAVAAILIAREFFVPADFGAHEQGYMYGWHRKANEGDWKKVEVKYQGRGYCNDCHPEKLEMIAKTPHAIIQCENCHGPAMKHPDDPPKLAIDKTREQCLRCHAKLPYKGSGRMVIRGIENDKHNPGVQCADCHNPHKPGMN